MTSGLLLCTDLDRTLLPNGSWTADSEAIDLFNELTEKQGVFVVYVTGRNLALTENAIKEFGVRYPDVLCGDVGTSIRRHENGKWEFDDGWVAFDLEITEELEIEGLMRDFLRQMQVFRRDIGLEIEDHITVRFRTDSKKIKTAIETNREFLRNELLCVQLLEDSTFSPEKILKISEKEVLVAVRKIEPSLSG